MISKSLLIFKLKGPMTYTSAEGKTTLYGIQHATGSQKIQKCHTSTLLIRVSTPEILKWIKKNIKKYQ